MSTMETGQHALAKDDDALSPYMPALQDAVEQVFAGANAQQILQGLLVDVPPASKAALIRRFNFALEERKTKAAQPALLDDPTANDESDGGEARELPPLPTIPGQGAPAAAQEEPPAFRMQKPQTVSEPQPVPVAAPIAASPAVNNPRRPMAQKRRFGFLQAAMLMAAGTFDKIHSLIMKRPDLQSKILEIGTRMQNSGVVPDYVLLERLEQIRVQAVQKLQAQQRGQQDRNR